MNGVIAKRSNYLSILLLSAAISIAVTEYVSYVPPRVGVEDFGEEDVLAGEDEVIEKVQRDESATKSTDGRVAIAPELEQEAALAQEKEEPKVAEQKAKAFPASGQLAIKINKGGTLSTELTKLGFNKTDVHKATSALAKAYDLRNIKVGQEVVVNGSEDPTGELKLTSLEIAQNYRHKIVVTRKKNGFSAAKVEMPIKKVIRTVSGKLLPSEPAQSLKRCGMKAAISRETLRGLSNILLGRQSRQPLEFEVLYRDLYDEKGNCVGNPELLYISALVEGKIKRIYNYKVGEKNEYIDANGLVLNQANSGRAQLIPPLSAMHITSHYGVRRHPISGRYKRHTGIDLSARVGTPVKAASAGVVQKANMWSGYGRYVRIRHTPRISTAYGHLSRIVVRPGQQVSQGQIIGYTGASGYTSGPHLHYEVLRDGTQINPLTTIKREPYRLTGKALIEFNQFKKEINLQLVGLHPAGPKKQEAKI
ncbi:MAG: M23 family metallopeptidase [Holosporales bacterium]|jgi:murein DD-endopeptidase MepM/ murein hydrolase activator NlpD|nr:M23 family metallopeptidase [Holosporales bacterium]